MLTALCISNFTFAATVDMVNSDLFNAFSLGGTVSYNQVDSNNTVLILAVVGENGFATASAIYDPGPDQINAVNHVEVDQNGAWVQLLTFDLGTVSAGNVDITLNGVTGDVSFFQLEDATVTGLSTASDTATNGIVSTAPDFTGLDSGSFILSAVTSKQGQPSNGTWSADGSPTFSNVFDSGGFLTGVSYQTDTTGTTLSWTHGDVTDNHALAAIAIAAVPEPSSLVLVGLAVGTTFLLRRKRR